MIFFLFFLKCLLGWYFDRFIWIYVFIIKEIVERFVLFLDLIWCGSFEYRRIVIFVFDRSICVFSSKKLEFFFYIFCFEKIKKKDKKLI